MTVFQGEGQLQAIQSPTRGYGRGMTLVPGQTEFGVGDFQTYADLWRRQPNVRLVTSFLARNIAQLGLGAFTRVSDDERRRLAPTTALARIIRHPNPYTTRYDFFDALVLDLKVYDLFVAIKMKNQVTGRVNLFRLPPYMVAPKDNGDWLFASEYEIKGTKGTIPVTRDQLVIIHGYNPSDPRQGCPPIETLRRLLAEDAAAGEWREQYWRNAARISGIIERPENAPKWSDPARNRFRSDFQSIYSGNGALAGATPVLEEGMKWVAASFSAKDSEYLDARRLSREETAAYYFVSPLFVGILEHANFSNVAEQHKHLYQDTLGPDLTKIEEALELQLLPEFPELDPDLTYLEFNLAEKLKGSFLDEAAAISTAVGAPWMTRNEARAKRNMGPLAGGDELVTPLNVLVGGQASSRTPVSGLAALALPPAPAAPGRGAKSVSVLPPTLQGWHSKHLEVVQAFFTRQRASVTTKLGAGQDLEAAFQADRWDGELTSDLFAVASTMVTEVGNVAAEQFGGTFDHTLADAYLAESARFAAENINAATLTALEAAMTGGEASRSKGIFDSILSAAVGAVFDFAFGTRSEEIATTRTTGMGMFATHEAAAQSGLLFKVWNVNSDAPREGHPDDGETVALDDVFSNGARWPGDSAAGVDQTANCTCSLSYTTEE